MSDALCSIYIDRYESGAFGIVIYFNGSPVTGVRRNNWAEAIEFARNWVKERNTIKHEIFMSSDQDPEEQRVVDIFDEDELLKLYLSL